MKDRFGIEVDSDESTVHIETINSIIEILSTNYVLTRKEMLDMRICDIIDRYVEWRDGECQ